MKKMREKLNNFKRDYSDTIAFFVLLGGVAYFATKSRINENKINGLNTMFDGLEMQVSSLKQTVDSLEKYIADNSNA